MFLGTRAESSTQSRGPQGAQSEGVQGLKALGVRDLLFRIAFLACSISTCNRKVRGHIVVYFSAVYLYGCLNCTSCLVSFVQMGPGNSGNLGNKETQPWNDANGIVLNTTACEHCWSCEQVPGKLHSTPHLSTFSP